MCADSDGVSVRERWQVLASMAASPCERRLLARSCPGERTELSPSFAKSLRAMIEASRTTECSSAKPRAWRGATTAASRGRRHQPIARCNPTHPQDRCETRDDRVMVIVFETSLCGAAHVVRDKAHVSVATGSAALAAQAPNLLAHRSNQIGTRADQAVRHAAASSVALLYRVRTQAPTSATFGVVAEAPTRNKRK